MIEGLLKNEIKTSLEEIIEHCFYGNRIVDRICSLISVKFVMPNTENILHHKYAHKLPLLADEISGYMDARNCTTIYNETPKGDQEYKNVGECFEKILEINLELEKKTMESISMALKFGDYTTKVFLENFLYNLIPLTKDIQLLLDKYYMYGKSNKDNMDFDNDIKSFDIFGD